MYIPKVSFFNANMRQHFNGIFREVERSTYEDTEQRYDVTSVRAIYHPNKHETEEKIKIAMDKYNAQRDEVVGDMIFDGGIDMYGNPIKTRGWSSTTLYSCSRGERLPY